MNKTEFKDSEVVSSIKESDQTFTSDSNLNLNQNQNHNHPHPHQDSSNSCKKKKGSSKKTRIIVRCLFTCFMVLSFILNAFVYKTGHSPIISFYLNLCFYLFGTLTLIYYLFCSLTSNKLSYLKFYQGSNPKIYNKKICQKCPSNNVSRNRIKPERVHHCSVCKTCISKMDHHCMFIQNCVGYWNHKSYYLLLFIGSFWGTTHSYILSKSLIELCKFVYHLKKMFWFYVCLFICIQLAVMAIGMLISVLNLCGYHTKMAFMNLTTIEDMVDNGMPYNLGILTNLRWFFGGKLQWLLPFKLSFLSKGEKRVEGLVYNKKVNDFSKIKEKLRYKNSQKIAISGYDSNDSDQILSLDELIKINKSKFFFKNKKNLVFLYNGKQYKDTDLKSLYLSY